MLTSFTSFTNQSTTTNTTTSYLTSTNLGTNTTNTASTGSISTSDATATTTLASNVTTTVATTSTYSNSSSTTVSKTCPDLTFGLILIVYPLFWVTTHFILMSCFHYCSHKKYRIIKRVRGGARKIMVKPVPQGDAKVAPTNNSCEKKVERPEPVERRENQSPEPQKNKTTKGASTNSS